MTVQLRVGVGARRPASTVNATMGRRNSGVCLVALSHENSGECSQIRDAARRPRRTDKQLVRRRYDLRRVTNAIKGGLQRVVPRGSRVWLTLVHGNSTRISANRRRMVHPGDTHGTQGSKLTTCHRAEDAEVIDCYCRSGQAPGHRFIDRNSATCCELTDILRGRSPGTFLLHYFQSTKSRSGATAYHITRLGLKIFSVGFKHYTTSTSDEQGTIRPSGKASTHSTVRAYLS